MTDYTRLACANGAEWNGVWESDGYQMVAGNGDFSVVEMNSPIPIEALGGGSYSVMGYVLTGDENALDADVKEWKDGSYWERYFRALALDEQTAMFFYARGHFETDTKTEFWVSEMMSGLLSKGSPTITPRPWAGDYEVTFYDFEGRDGYPGSTRCLKAQSVGHIEDRGGGQFFAWIEVAGVENGVLVQEVGDHLEGGDSATVSGGAFQERKVRINQGPGGKLVMHYGSLTYESADRNGIEYAHWMAGSFVPKAATRCNPTVLDIGMYAGIVVAGDIGCEVTVEYSSDAEGPDWHPLQTLVLTESPTVVIDWDSPYHGKRFYRALGPGGESPQPGPDMVWIEPGTFMMGSPNSESGRNFHEGPQTQVTLTQGFWLGTYEVTQAEYQAVRGTNPSNWKGDDLPVERVSWNDAVAYCEQRTEQERTAGTLPEGYEYRLPTEAQWEYACRAGTTTRFSFGDSDSDLGQYAWYDGNSSSRTHPAGQKLPNAWGLYDMHGNVWEWCADWYGSYPGGSMIDPTGANTGSNRVYRGGGWSGNARFCRSAYRGNFPPSDAYSILGFRVALVPVP